MGFAIGVHKPKIYEFKGVERFSMGSYPEEAPFEGKMVGAEDFIRALRNYSDEFYQHDPHQPYWYYRPVEHYEIYRTLKHHPNAETFSEWLDWLRAHPDAWVEGSH